MDEKSYENILFYDISYKTSFGAKPLRIRFDKLDVFIKVYDRIRFITLFGSENLMPFTIELDILLVKKV